MFLRYKHTSAVARFRLAFRTHLKGSADRQVGHSCPRVQHGVRSFLLAPTRLPQLLSHPAVLCLWYMPSVSTHSCSFQEASVIDMSLAACTEPGICVCHPDFPEARLQNQGVRQTPGGNTQTETWSVLMQFIDLSSLYMHSCPTVIITRKKYDICHYWVPITCKRVMKSETPAPHHRSSFQRALVSDCIHLEKRIESERTAMTTLLRGVEKWSVYVGFVCLTRKPSCFKNHFFYFCGLKLMDSLDHLDVHH